MPLPPSDEDRPRTRRSPRPPRLKPGSPLRHIAAVEAVTSLPDTDRVDRVNLARPVPRIAAARQIRRAKGRRRKFRYPYP